MICNIWAIHVKLSDCWLTNPRLENQDDLQISPEEVAQTFLNKWRKHFLTSGANISWQVAQTFLDKWRKISLKMAQTFLNKWHKHFLTSGSNISWKMAQTFLWTKTLLFLLVIGVKKFGYCPVSSVHHPNCCVRNGKQMELFSPCYQRYFCV